MSDENSAYQNLIRGRIVPTVWSSAVGQLLQALPAVYRERDTSGDLAHFLEAFAGVLDQLRGNLLQRLEDASPHTCQAWLLPYFADLLDVRLVSPDEDGQRQEIGEAIGWRQRKGTVGAAVQIAEAVGQIPIIAFEGHRSVATTPRVDERQSTMRELGEAAAWPDEPRTPSRLAARPGTPAVTVDFRKISRPRYLEDDNAQTPHSIKSHFGDQEIRWQHESAPHGVPPSLNGYQDIAMRTVDVRDSDWKQGHHHPRRLRLYTPVPEGFLKASEQEIIGPSAIKHLVKMMDPPLEAPFVFGAAQYWMRVDRNDSDPELAREGTQYIRIEERRAPVGAASTEASSRQVRIRSTLVTAIQPPPAQASPPSLPECWQELWGKRDSTYLENWETYFDDKPNLFLVQWEQWYEEGRGWCVRLRGGTWKTFEGKPGTVGMPLTGREHILEEPRWPTLDAPTILGPATTSDDPDSYLIVQTPDPKETFSVEITQVVMPQTLILRASSTAISFAALRAVKAVLISKSETELQQGISAAHVRVTDSLMYHLDATGLIAEFEYCTVALGVECKELRASDSILLGSLAGVTDRLRLRYCATPRSWQGQSAGPTDCRVLAQSMAARAPELIGQVIVEGQYLQLDASRFGCAGYGALHQSCHESIRRGAEDGGELGAYHHRRYCGRQDAVVEKLKDFLPAGTIPVLIVDENWQAPQGQHSGSEGK